MAAEGDGHVRPAHWFFKRSDGLWHPYSSGDNAAINLADALDAPAQSLQAHPDCAHTCTSPYAAQLHRNLGAPVHVNSGAALSAGGQLHAGPTGSDCASTAAVNRRCAGRARVEGCCSRTAAPSMFSPYRAAAVGRGHGAARVRVPPCALDGAVACLRVRPACRASEPASACPSLPRRFAVM